jgi:protein translocase SecG subunit
MEKYLPVLQIVFAVLLICAILLQQRGTGLGGAFGADANVYRSKRGIEKFLFYFTIVSAILLVITTIANILLNQ